MLERGKPLRLKMGFDPSRPDIHLGHVVGLRKLRQLQELGHEVILIVGDWTAQIGDPSGQSATRPILTHQEVVANAESYLRQFFKVIDHDRAEVVWQSEWFGKFTLEDVIRLTSKFTVAQFLERADFESRFREHRPIAVTEFLYPLLQAYDSVEDRGRRGVRRDGPEVQPAGGQRAPGDERPNPAAVLYDAPAGGYRRPDEDEQELEQLCSRRGPAQRHVRQAHVSPRPAHRALPRVPDGHPRRRAVASYRAVWSRAR